MPFTVTRDDVAPVAGVSVPGKVPTGTFTVTWSAMDDDSGVAVYDVQVKVDDGGWTAWLTDTEATEAVYSGELGHRYTFRVRATDNVNNTGAWAEASAVVVQITKYYTFGDRRVAMRQGDVVYYLYADHLGSVSVVSDGSGDLLAAQLYYPYGEVRWRAGTLPTDFGFTGQRAEASIGLLDYRARYYDPALGRFVSADTLVPEPGNPQDLNRYAYVRNSPLRYTDPSGRWLFEESPNDPYFIPPSSLHEEAQRRQDFITPSSPQPPIRTPAVKPLVDFAANAIGVGGKLADIDTKPQELWVANVRYQLEAEMAGGGKDRVVDVYPDQVESGPVTVTSQGEMYVATLPGEFSTENYHQVSEAEFGISQHPSITSVKFSVGRRMTHELLGESLMVSVETTERIEVEIRPVRLAVVSVAVGLYIWSQGAIQPWQWFRSAPVPTGG